MYHMQLSNLFCVLDISWNSPVGTIVVLGYFIVCIYTHAYQMYTQLAHLHGLIVKETKFHFIA